MPAPRILIVDDQRDISRMLRTALETLGHGYVILDVPSAEEAQLEMRRGQIDLLITDLRLPGISGLELIHKLRRGSSEAALIVISAYADEITRAEIGRLGATFFAKPLSLAEFLAGVQRTLGARLANLPAAPEPPAEDPSSLATRLARLRRDLGALAVGLVDTNARLVLRDGDFTPLALDALLAPLLTAMAATSQISAALGGRGPNSLTYVDGQTYDLYTAGVGAGHALLIFFEGERGANQMGPVMRYGRQCADELLPLLSPDVLPTPPAPVAFVPGITPLRRASDTAPLAAPAAPPSTAPRRRTGDTKPLVPPPAPARPLTAAELQQLDDAAKSVTSDAAASFWKEAGADDIGDHRSDTLSFDQATQLGLIKGKKPS